MLEVRLPFKMEIPEDILAIKNVFQQKNYKLYVVGGAVRDFLLNQKIKDYDLATDAIPDTVETMMEAAGFKTLPTGKSFGVINVFTDKGEYEIATMREDSTTSDGRRPDSVKFTDIKTDVLRRDLTINALFFDIETHEVVDLVGGIEDIKNNVIRTVGVPEERFIEDKLRKLRAIRFAARFGSELDLKLDEALGKDSGLDGISGERIRDEFLKGIKSAKSIKQFLEMLDRYHLFNWIFKGLNVNKDFIEDRNVVVLIAILLRGNTEAVLNKELNNLKYSVEEIKSITFLLSLLDLIPETAVALKRRQKNSYTSRHLIIDFANRMGLDLRLINTFLNFELSVTGEDVMRDFNLKPSKELGDKINEIEKDNFFKLL